MVVDTREATELITVVIPAYNAAKWIGQTLASVQCQTHRSLEIIVIDDGSTDATRSVVEAFAAHDPRIILISQSNGGVARARNAGLQAASGRLVAFIDADDLWAPTKIERQLRTLLASPPGTELVYSLYVMIDEQAQIIYQPAIRLYHGDVLDDLLRGNFIGNGSSVLVTRAAAQAVGGFEPALRDAGAQGCEDILFYCRLAERFRFAVVPAYEVGYRQLSDNMSSNLLPMLRSWMLVLREFGSRHPERRAILAKGLSNYCGLLMRRAIFARKGTALCGLLWFLAPREPLLAFRMIVWTIPRTLAQSLEHALAKIVTRATRRSIHSTAERASFADVSRLTGRG